MKTEGQKYFKEWFGRLSIDSLLTSKIKKSTTDTLANDEDDSIYVCVSDYYYGSILDSLCYLKINIFFSDNVYLKNGDSLETDINSFLNYFLMSFGVNFYHEYDNDTNLNFDYASHRNRSDRNFYRWDNKNDICELSITRNYRNDWNERQVGYNAIILLRDKRFKFEER